MSGTGKRAVRQSIRIAAPPERVFAALTDPAALRGWLCRTAEWIDEAGGVLRVGWPGTAFEAGDATLGEWAGAHEGWAVYLCNLLLVVETGRDLREGQPPGTILS